MVNQISYGSQPAQLESLDSLRANSAGSVQRSQAYALQSLDSIRANNYSDPNMVIPNNNVLSPIEALSPTIPTPSKEQTKEKGALGFIGGVFNGIGSAAADTGSGLVTLVTTVGGAIVNPKKTLNWIGGGVSYAASNPGKAAKAVLVDLPVGIVKGIVNPYKEAIQQGQYGKAVGRGVFDIGLILLTAGLGESKGAGAVDDGAGVIDDVIDDGASAIDDIANGIDDVGNGIDDVVSGVDDIVDGIRGTTAGSTTVITKGGAVEGGIHIGENAIKMGNVGEGAKVVINIGSTTSKTTVHAARVSTAASQGASVAAETAKVAGKTASAASKAAVAAETAATVAGTGNNLFSLMGRGFTRIKNAIVGANVGQSINSGLTAIVGEGAATGIRNTFGAIGRALGKTGQAVKSGAVFVKTYPVPTALISGRVTSIVEEGMKDRDYYAE